MRVFIKCKSLLLQKILDIFLKDIKCNNLNQSDFCVSDKKIKKKDTFLIGKDILHPFTKDELLKKLKKYNLKREINF